MAGRNFLEVEPNYNSLLNITEVPDIKDLDICARAPVFRSIKPTSGFCVKAKTKGSEKVFINLCHCPDVPPPPSSLNVSKIVSSEDPDEESVIRFPLSIGELHIELDNKGKECKCYDVVINRDYFQEVLKDSYLRDFIITLACSGIDRKYNLSLDVGSCTVLNKPYHGSMPNHFIRFKSDVNLLFPPVEKIIPVHTDSVSKHPVQILPSKGPSIYHYDFFRTPATGNPSLLTFQGLTKNIKDKKSLLIFVSKGKLTVKDAEGKSLLSIALPYTIVPEKTISNFWKNKLYIALVVRSN